MNKVYLSLIGMLFCLSEGHAQVAITQSNRFEVVLREGEEHYQIATAEEKGLYLFRRESLRFAVKDADKKQSIWTARKLNASLQEQWREKFYLDRNFDFQSKKVNSEQLYLLFRHRERGTRRMKLVRLDSENGQTAYWDIKSALQLTIQDFHIMNRGVLVEGYLGSRPIALFFDFTTGVPRLLPGLFMENSRWMQLNVLPERIEALIGVYGRRQNALIWRVYDTQGNILDNKIIRSAKGKGLNFARLTSGKNEEGIIAGTYGNINSEYSRGVFLTKVDIRGSQDIQYHNYGDLKQFFGYMKARRERRVLERIRRRKSKNRKIRFSYRLLLHELTKKNGQYLLFGEAFYPKYRSTSRAYGQVSPVFSFDNGLYNAARVFDGYRYTHAVVIAFDENGELLWDNSFEINDVTSFELGQFVDISIQDELSVLLYIKDNILNAKVIEKGNVIKDKTQIDIDLGPQEGVVEKSPARVNGVEAWYDNAFLAYGTQKVRKPALISGLSDVEVFFINKVTYQ